MVLVHFGHQLHTDCQYILRDTCSVQFYTAVFGSFFYCSRKRLVAKMIYTSDIGSTKLKSRCPTMKNIKIKIQSNKKLYLPTWKCNGRTSMRGKATRFRASSSCSLIEHLWKIFLFSFKFQARLKYPCNNSHYYNLQMSFGQQAASFTARD